VQLLVLVIASSGDRHRTHRSNPVIISPNKVAALFIAMVVTCVGATALLATVGVAQLDKATALQCRTHDWPVKAHKIHMDWCADNGYATK
jgi:high-affinity K+ transport system ATPase subunit B